MIDIFFVDILHISWSFSSNFVNNLNEQCELKSGVGFTNRTLVPLSGHNGEGNLGTENSQTEAIDC